MKKNSKIDKKRLERGLYWQRAWSIVEGCSRVDAACDNCWLAAMNSRFMKGNSSLLLNGAGEWNGRVLCRPDRLGVPASTSSASVFCLWSDLFHESVSNLLISKVLYTAIQSARHTFLFCTKRPERIARCVSEYVSLYLNSTGREWDKNASHLWFGTTVQDSSAGALRRLSELCSPDVFLPHRFLSVEPMLGPVSLCSLGSKVSLIDLIIVGCESGSKRRRPDDIWLKDLVSQCESYDIPLFLKQWNLGGKVVKLPYGKDHKLSQLPF